MIIEIAKNDNWLSIKNLKELTGKGTPTITNYIKKDISGLLESQDFIEYVARGKEGKGKGKTAIEKYKLKPGLDNVLAALDILDDKTKREFLKTKYYQDHAPLIADKLKCCINYYNKAAFDTILMSPVAVAFVLRLTKENYKNIIAKSKSFFKKDLINKLFPGSSAGFKLIKKLNIGYEIVFFAGLYELAVIDNITDNPDIFKMD